jgi:Protein of unknown function (DUF3237)
MCALLVDPRATVDAAGMVRTVPVAELFELVAELESRLDTAPGAEGLLLDRVRAGTFRGPRLRGTVIPGGGDWGWRRAGGVQVIDARLMLRTDDGALISMTYGGRAVIPPDVRPLLADPARWHEIDPARYYFRSTPVFETGSPAYAWLNDLVAVGHGFLAPDGAVGYRVSHLL